MSRLSLCELPARESNPSEGRRDGEPGRRGGVGRVRLAPAAQIITCVTR